MEAVSYQCPNCGAPLEFHSETQKWDCKFCLSSFEESDLEEYNRKQEQKQKEEQERLLIPQMVFYFDVDISDFIFLK